MTREEFDKIALLPGFVVVEVWDANDPCTAITHQPCRILRHAPGYDGPLDAGTKVVLVVSSDRFEHWESDLLTRAIISLSGIAGVMKG